MAKEKKEKREKKDRQSKEAALDERPNREVPEPRLKRHYHDVVVPKLKEQFAKSFPPAALDNIKWYPPVPAGLEDVEGRVLERVKAARAG